MVADKLSRLGQTIQTERSLLPEVFQTICNRWHRPQIDLFATRFNNKLPLFVSPVLDLLATAVDVLSLNWEDLDTYAFPPAAILGKVMEKLQDTPCKRIILIAWVAQHALVLGSSGHVHPNLTEPSLSAKLVTAAFQSDPSQKSDQPESPCMAPRASVIKEQGFSEAVAARIEAFKGDPPDQSMRQSGPFLQSGASLIRWTSGHPL